ncbi:hypothetical protein KFK09_017828 [Dendrobium nobile]|uniref:Uncharacterized protein n=1 Tax=Dendrobium nobile TaxID=94219 RepID=A0A8T3AV69_DENNO|nr:hypothetical protein KFK09_017828 [Dendrobium nobile]
MHDIYEQNHLSHCWIESQRTIVSRNKRSASDNNNYEKNSTFKENALYKN